VNWIDPATIIANMASEPGGTYLAIPNRIPTP